MKYFDTIRYEVCVYNKIDGTFIVTYESDDCRKAYNFWKNLGGDAHIRKIEVVDIFDKSKLFPCIRLDKLGGIK